MTFLKKLGSILASLAGEALGLSPLLRPFFGSGKVAAAVSTGVNDLTAIASTVVQIETALQGHAGADKFAALLPLVGNIIKTSELVSGKKIADADKFQAAVKEISQGVVDLLNSIHEDEAKHA